MFKIFLLLAALTTIMVSCNSSHSANGTYVIYQVDQRHPSVFNLNLLNDTINTRLKSYFLNQRYKISFQDKYATIQPTSGNEVILTKVDDNGKVTYKQSVNKGIATMEYTLQTDTDNTLLLAVDLAMPNNEQAFRPVQMPTNDQEHKHGMAICHLSKVE